jgi:predicted nucleic acid-binding protein
VQPLLHNNSQLQQEYRDLLLHSDHFEVTSIEMIIAERAADLRARYGLRTPDALQIAAALISGCQAFLTIVRFAHHQIGSRLGTEYSGA